MSAARQHNLASFVAFVVFAFCVCEGGPAMLPRRVIPFTEPSEKVSPGAARPQLVQIGRDRELLRLRAKIIHSAGYTVHSIFPDEATAAVRKTLGGRV
jgi:hypothetical protein